MLTVDEAIEAILARVQPLPPQSFPLIEALGATLAENIRADLDLPPFDKALVDGYAIKSANLAHLGPRRFKVIEQILAGRLPTRALDRDETAQIMTGAPLPPGADSVVMVEKARILRSDQVELDGPVTPGLNRLSKGREMKADEILLTSGTRIDPAKLGLIASAGRSNVLVIPRPGLVVVPTGDELVPIDQIPAAGQIRNTNAITLAGLARAWGAREVVEHPIAPDDPWGLGRALGAALRSNSTDVLIISGGVSAGIKDLVPSTLIDLDVEPVFHQVAVKPGKPIWFGVGPARPDGRRPLVFGLPGNPASGVVGFHLFVKPALDALAGRRPERGQLASFPLDKPFTHRGDRPTYHPSRLVEGRVAPLDWAGSADLRTVALAGGFAVFPAGDRTYDAGEAVAFLPMIGNSGS